MGTAKANVPDNNAAKVAQLYILIEFQKLFSDINDQKFWDTFAGSLEGLEARTSSSTFWGLLSGISEAVRLNGVHQYLTDDSFSWQLEDVALKDLMLTGMGPVVDPITLDLCERDPLKFKKEWANNPNVRKTLTTDADITTQLTTSYPIIVFEREGKLAVFDGMHRTLATIISGKDSIQAWVGRVTNPQGKPLINSQMSMLLWKVWKASDTKDEELKKTLRRIGEEIVVDYRNGHDSLVERIAGWSRDDEFIKIFEGL